MAGVFTHRVGLTGAAVTGTDPNISSVGLLLSGDGTNGSTTFTDESPAAHGSPTVNGNTQVSTTNPKFGTGSIQFDGSGDNLQYANHADWLFGSGAFTVELWVRFDTASIEVTQALIDLWTTSGNQRCWTLQYNGGAATNTLQFAGSSGGSSADLSISSNWTPTADQWYHIAVDRSGNVFRLYIDGAMVATTTTAFTLHSSISDLRIGNIFSISSTAFLDGNLDEIRITKGVARYASDGGFTVPTAAYPRS